MDYYSMLREHGRMAVSMTPDIPDARLMIGSAEVLEPQPLLIPQQYRIPREIAKGMTELEQMDNDTVTRLIDEQSLEINDFNGNTALIGGMIGGVR